MKKIISLLLAICMMASLTVVAFAEETSASFVDVEDIVEFYRIGQTITDDVVTNQAVTYYNLSTMGDSSAILTGNYKNRWVLFRVPIGEGWDLTSLTFSGRARANKASITYVRLMLSSKADYDKAVAASGSNITADFLPRPYDATENVIVGTVDRSKSTSMGYQGIADIEPLTDTTALANSYDGQYLYLALAVDGSQAQTLRKGYPLTFTITGEKQTTFADATSSVAVAGNTATVTTDAQAGTAKLIAASYNGDEMADVIVATVDAADADSLSVDISGLTGATKKVFLWANDMITPLADAVSL